MTKELCSVSIKNGKLDINVWATLLLKKVWWAEQNVSFNVSTTIPFRIITIGLEDALRKT